MLISLAALAGAAYHCIRRPSVCLAASIKRSHLSITAHVSPYRVQDCMELAV